MKLLKTKLYKKQIEASSLALERDVFALFMQQRTGKTITALKIAAVRWRRQGVKLILVVAPKNALGSWERQIDQHLNIDSVVYTGVGSLKDVKKCSLEFSGMVFLVINYERLWRAYYDLRRLPIGMMILDESHRIRNRNSRQSKSAWRLGKLVKYKLILTGTPQGKDETDLWAQMRFLDESLFGSRWKEFDKRYLRKSGFGGYKRKFRRGMDERMLRKIAPLTYRVEADEMYDLPPEVDIPITFELTGKAKKAYRDMEDHFIAEVDEEYKSTSTLAITKMIRLQQLTGGFMGLDDKSLLRLEQDKLVTFADWLEDFPRDKKLVVCALYTHEIDMLCEVMKKFGRSYVVRDGRTKDLNAWIDFQEKPHPSTYIMQVTSGGVGIDLYRSEYLVFYSHTFSFIDYDQARKRICLAPHTTFIHMIAKNTIDEDRYLALKDKGHLAVNTLKNLKLRRLKMARKKTDNDNSEEQTPKRQPPKVEKPKYGIDELAEALNTDDKAAVRTKLRNAGDDVAHYKQGRVWDFENKRNLEAVAKVLSKVKSKKKKEANED